MSGKIKPYAKRYGNVAIEKGYITQKQLLDALDIQVRDEVNDRKHRLIGVILCDLQYITLEQNDEILDELAKV